MDRNGNMAVLGRVVGMSAAERENLLKRENLLGEDVNYKSFNLLLNSAFNAG